MKPLKLTNHFLIKRRHQRRVPEMLFYDVGEQFRIFYGQKHIAPLHSSPDRLMVYLSPSRPAVFSNGALHQTTEWCIKMLEKYYLGGHTLDVGTGTGLLAICAARLAAAHQYHYKIEAFDIYQDAVYQAKVNLSLNGLRKQILLSQACLEDFSHNRYDFIIANLPPIAIPQLWPTLMEILAPHSLLILGGILNHNWQKLNHKFTQAGLMVRDSIITDFWCLAVLERKL